jgi:hypothetical protein
MKVPGMTVKGVTHTEKEPAAKALLEACKTIDKNADNLVGEYMGFKMAIRFETYSHQFSLLLRGAMTYQVELGADALGNITRINNALDSLAKRLDGAKEQQSNIQKQIAAAKEELSKPFPQEAELKEKEVRLALLNADLNIDGDGGMDVINDTENRAERTESDELPDDEYGEQETNDVPFTLVNPGRTFTYGNPSERTERTGTYGKSIPSILDDVRSFNNERKSPEKGGGKSAEIDI